MNIYMGIFGWINEFGASELHDKGIRSAVVCDDDIIKTRIFYNNKNKKKHKNVIKFEINIIQFIITFIINFKINK